jgi:hypothetical protein
MMWKAWGAWGKSGDEVAHATAAKCPGARRTDGEDVGGGVLAAAPNGRLMASAATASNPLAETQATAPSGPAAIDLVVPVFDTINRIPPPLTPGMVSLYGIMIDWLSSPTRNCPFGR